MGFTCTSSAPAEGEIKVSKDSSFNKGSPFIAGRRDFQRPITVEAEIKADGYSNQRKCIAMTLFATSDNKNADISLEIGDGYYSGDQWRFNPGDNRGNAGTVYRIWRKVKLELDNSNNVKYYIDDDLKYTTTSTKKQGKLRFIAGCQTLSIKNIKIGMKIES